MFFARRLASRFGARAACGLAATATASVAACHGGDGGGRLERLEAQVASLAQQLAAQHDVQQTTGQGDAVFSWDRERTACFPDDAKPFEKEMHGAFTEDVETGVVYTGIPGYGLCAISPDLTKWARLGVDERLKGNIHGLVCFKHGGETLLALAQNDDSRVLICGLDGRVRQQLSQPKGGEFDFGEANAYYSDTPIVNMPPYPAPPHAPRFACTDVTYLNGRLYVVTGYCEGDFCLTATEKDGKWAWGPTAWGGKGSERGRFSTAHGVFAHDGHIFVANREAHQVLEFTPEGSLVRAMPDLPHNARICNVAYAGDHKYFVMNALEPIRHTPAKTAPIYAHSGERLLSTIEPGELGIPVLKHLHNVWPHYVVEADGKRRLYLLVHGWSAGKYAVLKHEPDGAPSVPRGWRYWAEDGLVTPRPKK